MTHEVFLSLGGGTKSVFGSFALLVMQNDKFKRALVFREYS